MHNTSSIHINGEPSSNGHKANLRCDRYYVKRGICRQVYLVRIALLPAAASSVQDTALNRTELKWVPYFNTEYYTWSYFNILNPTELQRVQNLNKGYTTEPYRNDNRIIGNDTVVRNFKDNLLIVMNRELIGKKKNTKRRKKRKKETLLIVPFHLICFILTF